MEMKRAGELKCGDGVLVVGEYRVVEAVEFTEGPIDSSGTSGVRVRWFGRPNASIIAADKEMTLIQPEVISLKGVAVPVADYLWQGISSTVAFAEQRLADENASRQNVVEMMIDRLRELLDVTM
jgi:hypothetical protein